MLLLEYINKGKREGGEMEGSKWISEVSRVEYYVSGLIKSMKWECDKEVRERK